MTSKAWKRRRWNKAVATNLRQALEWCKDYAKDIHNLSVERIAEGMGLADHWALYKWIQTGRMPAVMIPAYERVCGCDFVSRWLAASSGYLVVKIPSGKAASATDVLTLQGEISSAISTLVDFYNGKSDVAETLAELRKAMEGLAHHHRNVEEFHTPELPLDLGDEE
ncbi:hypothetical protein MO867_18035 [Microbulbifer sp. OS29]|uniref:Uncharacterized protein n=1 Tax=Microbulbifer okhotskensis TaxID=2926617 RepID=A0A9X2ER09_9GAMM|nr:hypothetical protein [Microbulbifer okhotskensis]MCO1336234.1 hypothetical protein [Microbulbifer okhotskensis]